MDLDLIQQEAVDLCTNKTKRIASVTGCAGTGKTTIIQMVADYFASKGKRVVCCAPTGKAARRVKEATGHEAMTIHRLLEFPRPGERDEKTGKALSQTEPKRCARTPVLYDVILCDEYAMVPHLLHRQLIEAMPYGSLLRCFGDVNQLAPIEDYKIQTPTYTDSPFKQLLKNFPSVVLKNIYRQDEGSGIFLNGTRIVKGQMPTKTQDFDLQWTDKPVVSIEEMVYNDATRWGRIDRQIIVPGNKGWVGTYELNQRIQLIVNPDSEGAFDPVRHKWQVNNKITLGVGDKVVCTDNCYDLRDFFERFGEFKDDGSPVGSSYIPCPDTCMMLNGETGIITEIDSEATHIDFGDRTVAVPHSIHEYNPRANVVYQINYIKSIDLGYVLTTHKCQGSEFKEIAYVLNKSNKWIQSRRNFYTAVTRARNKVTVISDRTSVGYSLWSLK